MRVNLPKFECLGIRYRGKYCFGMLRAVETPYPKVNPIQSNPMYFFRQAFFLCVIFYSMVSDGVTLKIMMVESLKFTIAFC